MNTANFFLLSIFFIFSTNLFSSEQKRSDYSKDSRIFFAHSNLSYEIRGVLRSGEVSYVEKLGMVYLLLQESKSSSQESKSSSQDRVSLDRVTTETRSSLSNSKREEQPDNIINRSSVDLRSLRSERKKPFHQDAALSLGSISSSSSTSFFSGSCPRVEIKSCQSSLKGL